MTLYVSERLQYIISQISDITFQYDFVDISGAYFTKALSYTLFSIYGLFDEAISSSGCIGSDDRVMCK